MSGEYLRNPKLVWRDEPERREEILATLGKGVEDEESGWVIVVDGGDIHQLNLIAGDIWMLCDGTRDEGSIAAELIKTYDVDPTMLAVDVTSFVRDCLEKGWLIRKDT